jgi:hypothetical protein
MVVTSVKKKKRKRADWLVAMWELVWLLGAGAFLLNTSDVIEYIRLEHS